MAEPFRSTSDPQKSPGSLVVVAPFFNEGEVAVTFVKELMAVLQRLPQRCIILMMDDASTDDTVERLRRLGPGSGNTSIELMALDYNMGHQEAIYQGLLHAATLDADRIIVMDSDGEDDPEAIPEMLKLDAAGIVLVKRGKRRESLTFKLGYFLYKRLFRLVTRRTISFGNFSMIDRRVLNIVTDRGFVHYAAFLSKQRVTIRSIIRDRRPRLDGRSKMSFRSLTVHAFRSLIEYSEDLLALFLKAFFVLALMALLTIGVIIVLKLFTDQAIPGWASILSLSLLNCTLLCLGFFAIGLLLTNSLHLRQRTGRKCYQRIPNEL